MCIINYNYIKKYIKCIIKYNYIKKRDTTRVLEMHQPKLFY